MLTSTRAEGNSPTIFLPDMWMHRKSVLVCVVFLRGVLVAPAASGQDESGSAARYLYVWMGDADERDEDFIAVVDVRAASPTYGRVIATEPVRTRGSMPHHLEYVLPPAGRLLFANGHHHEQIFLFDISEAEHPRLVRTVPTVPPYRYPHDFMRLPNGKVLVGFLRSEGPSPLSGDTTVPGGHGGIAELDPEGQLIRSASAADPAIEVPIRPYAFALLPDIDRLVTTSAPMMEDHSADVVQVWRLSDLRLLHTLPVPPARLPDGKELMTRSAKGELEPAGHRYPFVPRVMADGSVLLNAYGCGFYRVTAIHSAEPRIENVYTIQVPPETGLAGCGIPVVVGTTWIMPVGRAHMIVGLDVSDPAHPVEVSRLHSDSTFVPHWLAKDPGSNRLVLGQEVGHEDRILMMKIDPETGRLWWDESFRSEDGSLGMTFLQTTWPHGETGAATGHAALFRP
jgi:hypothetical protein